MPGFAPNCPVGEFGRGRIIAGQDQAFRCLAGRDADGQTAVVRAKDRQTEKVAATVLELTDAQALQGFVEVVTERNRMRRSTPNAGRTAGIDKAHGNGNHGVGELCARRGSRERDGAVLVDAGTAL